jgi:nucleoside-diphosphate-sugar epimerase
MSPSDTAKKKILITGAAGKVGTLISRHLHGQYDLCLTDIQKPVQLSDCDFHQADICDYTAFRPLCNGVHTIVHLAAIADENSPWEPLLQNNIIGLYNVFEAAADAGCRRVIFASSIYAVHGYPKDVLVHTDMPVRPLTLYGTTKVFGEALGSFYAYQRNLPAICLRLGWVLESKNRHMTMNNLSLDTVITYDDVIRLFNAAIEVSENIRFGIFHGLSNNRRKRLDIQDTIDIINYHPQDDAFKLAQANTLNKKPRRLSDITISRLVNYIKKRFLH